MGSLGWLQHPRCRGRVGLSIPREQLQQYFLLLLHLLSHEHLGAAKSREGVRGTRFLWFGVCPFAWWLSQATWLLWASLLTGRTRSVLRGWRRNARRTKRFSFSHGWVGPARLWDVAPPGNPRVSAKPPSQPPQTPHTGHGGAPGVGSESSLRFKRHCVTQGMSCPTPCLSFPACNTVC